jgi:hypothetical protein
MTRKSPLAPMADKSLHRGEIKRCAKDGCKILSRDAIEQRPEV